MYWLESNYRRTCNARRTYTDSQLLYAYEELIFKNTLALRTVNPLRTKVYQSDLKTQSVPRSKHYASIIKTVKLMLHREIIAVCSEIHTKHINALWAEQRICEC